MNEIAWLQGLREVGRTLEVDGGLTVWRGGIVRPSGPPSTSQGLGSEKHHGSEQQRQYQRGPATGSRQGTAGREGAPGGSGSSRPASPLLLGDLAAEYQRQFEDLDEHYPEAASYAVEGGYWVRAESALLSGYGGRALFCMSFPFSARLPRSWAFLRPPVGTYSWVGPRHTNFPDGSICAFHMEDRTWVPGDTVVTLLDLYSVWVVRHLHLMTFGTWPGGQFVHSSYERLLESRDDEQCGCGSGNRYHACHKQRDTSFVNLAAATRMAVFDRGPPQDILRWAIHSGNPPPLFGGLA